MAILSGGPSIGKSRGSRSMVPIVRPKNFKRTMLRL